MGAIIAVPEQGEGGTGTVVIDGLLCQVDPSARRRRWLFGYDDDGVVLVGFALEFQREDADDEEWLVTRIDESPEDDCPDEN